MRRLRRGEKRIKSCRELSSQRVLPDDLYLNADILRSRTRSDRRDSLSMVEDRETERERERETERERKRERERERERERNREKEREREKERKKQRERERERERDGKRERG